MAFTTYKLQNLSDLDFDLLPSLKVDCDDHDPISYFLLVFNIYI